MNRSSSPRVPRLLSTLLTISLISLGLAGCVPTLRPSTQTMTAASAARAVRHGHYIEGSQAYQHLARHSTGTTRARYALKAAEALVRAGALRAADQELHLAKPPLTQRLAARKYALMGEIDAAMGHPARAYEEARKAQRYPNLPPQLQAEIGRIEAQASLSLGHPVRAARHMIARERLLVSRRRLTNNETALWHDLAALPRRRLRHLYDEAPTSAVGAWARLALIARRYPPRSQRLRAAITKWQHRYPKFIPTSTFLATILGAKGHPRPAPRAVALLLPLSSPFAKAAKAVERGFVAMAKTHPLAGHPTIYIYDIGSNPAAAAHYYQQAVKRGAQFIVGPLGAGAVADVAAHARFTVPTLLLGLAKNGPRHNPRHVPVYQFSLARTLEARQAADRAYLDGHTRAAILYPNSPFGHRMRRAFARRWRHLGGLVVAQTSYTPGSTGYVRPVEDLLDITQSRARDRRLQRILGMPLAFTARRRQDVGFVFLVADAPDARLIKPLLDYDHADTLPVYSTSSVFTGRPDPVYDRDLDGIIFGDMPWMLVGNGRIARLRRTLPNASRYNFTPFARLYAFGADAEGLVGRLDRLSLGGGGRYNGLTGGLSVRRDDVIRRTLVWAEFRKGIPRLLDTFLPYRGLFSKHKRTIDTTGRS